MKNIEKSLLLGSAYVLAALSILAGVPTHSAADVSIEQETSSVNRNCDPTEPWQPR